MVENVGTHPAPLGHIYNVETAVTLSVSCLVQTKALALGNSFDVLFLCVSHEAPLLICTDHTHSDEEWEDFRAAFCATYETGSQHEMKLQLVKSYQPLVKGVDAFSVARAAANR